MSSRLLPADADLPVGQVPWKQVKTNQSGPVDSRAGLAQEQNLIPEERVQQLQSAFEERERHAHAEGRREGEAEANQRCADELRGVVERAAKSLEEISGLRNRLRREAEGDLVRLALAIARRVVYRELAIDPDAMRGVVIAALERLQSQEISRVRVHPDLAKMLAASLARLGSLSIPEIIADPTRERGTLIFETSRGNLDASVDTQLQEIERGLVDQLRRSA